jgi:hypothetical protein
VPIDANCPLTAFVVDARVPVADEATEVADSAVLVGQIEVRAPGVVVQPVTAAAAPIAKTSFAVNCLRCAETILGLEDAVMC